MIILQNPPFLENSVNIPETNDMNKEEELQRDADDLKCVQQELIYFLPVKYLHNKRSFRTSRLDGCS